MIQFYNKRKLTKKSLRKFKIKSRNGCKTAKYLIKQRLTTKTIAKSDDLLRKKEKERYFNIKRKVRRRKQKWEPTTNIHHQALELSLTEVPVTKSHRMDLSVRRHQNQLTLKPRTKIKLPVLVV